MCPLRVCGYLVLNATPLTVWTCWPRRLMLLFVCVSRTPATAANICPHEDEDVELDLCGCRCLLRRPFLALVVEGVQRGR